MSSLRMTIDSGSVSVKFHSASCYAPSGTVEFVGDFTDDEVRYLRKVIVECNMRTFEVLVKNSPIKCPRFVMQRWQKRDHDVNFATMIAIGIQRRHEICSDTDVLNT